MDKKVHLTVEYFALGLTTWATVRVRFGDEVVSVHHLDLCDGEQVGAFARAVAEGDRRCNAVLVIMRLNQFGRERRAWLERHAQADETSEPQLVRAELFHTAQVSGILEAKTLIGCGRPTAQWYLYLRFADGTRDVRDPVEVLELPDGSQLYLRLPSGPPHVQRQQQWSSASRAAWMRGEVAPAPAAVFRSLCDQIAKFVEFPVESTVDQTATVAVWVLLTYAYPAWHAVAYLHMTGATGSGKTQILEVLERLVFRPFNSSSLTGPALFRTLDDRGGTLLFDEAEGLSVRDTATGDLVRILLAGYKRGHPATRLRGDPDGNWITEEFDVYGPKALAGIATLPPALSSRCIRISMIRAAPGSPRLRRRLDENPLEWMRLRDDLHVVALEYGTEWVGLSAAQPRVPNLSGRELELWGPLFAIASWLEQQGVEGLLGVIQHHATTVIAEARDDCTPEVDRLVLLDVADAVAAGRPITCKAVLENLRSAHDTVFNTGWTPERVASMLRRYGIKTRVSGSRRPIDASVAQLVEVQNRFSIDLGFGTKEPDTDPDREVNSEQEAERQELPACVNASRSASKTRAVPAPRPGDHVPGGTATAVARSVRRGGVPTDALGGTRKGRGGSQGSGADT